MNTEYEELIFGGTSLTDKQAQLNYLYMINRKKELYKKVEKELIKFYNY